MAKPISNADLSGISLKKKDITPSIPSAGKGILYFQNGALYFMGQNGKVLGPLGGSTILASTYNGNDRYFTVQNGWEEINSVTFTAPYTGYATAYWSARFGRINNGQRNWEFMWEINGVDHRYQLLDSGSGDYEANPRYLVSFSCPFSVVAGTEYTVSIDTRDQNTGDDRYCDWDALFVKR